MFLFFSFVFNMTALKCTCVCYETLIISEPSTKLRNDCIVYLKIFLMERSPVFWGKGLLCSPGWPGTCDSPLALVSQELGLQANATMPDISILLNQLFNLLVKTKPCLVGRCNSNNSMMSRQAADTVVLPRGDVVLWAPFLCHESHPPAVFPITPRLTSLCPYTLQIACSGTPVLI